MARILRPQLAKLDLERPTAVFGRMTAHPEIVSRPAPRYDPERGLRTGGSVGAARYPKRAPRDPLRRGAAAAELAGARRVEPARVLPRGHSLSLNRRLAAPVGTRGAVAAVGGRAADLAVERAARVGVAAAVAQQGAAIPRGGPAGPTRSVRAPLRDFARGARTAVGVVGARAAGTPRTWSRSKRREACRPGWGRTARRCSSRRSTRTSYPG